MPIERSDLQTLLEAIPQTTCIRAQEQVEWRTKRTVHDLPSRGRTSRYQDHLIPASHRARRATARPLEAGPALQDRKHESTMNTEADDERGNQAGSLSREKSETESKSGSTRSEPGNRTGGDSSNRGNSSGNRSDSTRMNNPTSRSSESADEDEDSRSGGSRSARKSGGSSATGNNPSGSSGR